VKNLKQGTILFFFFLYVISVHGQTDGYMTFSGKIINAKDSSAVALAHLASYTQVNMYAADSVGHFRIVAPVGDSLKIFAIGYESEVHILPKHLDGCEYEVLIALNPISYFIEEVKVSRYKVYDKYMDKLKAEYGKAKELNLNLPPDIKLGQKSKYRPSVRPDFENAPLALSAAIKPGRYIYYHFSKQEKERRKMMEIYDEEDLRRHLTKELIAEISALEGEKLEQFIIYCNINVKLTHQDTEMSVRQKVADAFDEFSKTETTN